MLSKLINEINESTFFGDNFWLYFKFKLILNKWSEPKLNFDKIERFIFVWEVYKAIQILFFKI